MRRSDTPRTADAIKVWAHFGFGIQVVMNQEELDGHFDRSQPSARVAVAFVTGLCDAPSRAFLEALNIYGQERGGKKVPAAIGAAAKSPSPFPGDGSTASISSLKGVPRSS